MKDLASCFTENAVLVSDITCSSGRIVASPIKSVRCAVCSVYRARLRSCGREVIVRLAWSNTRQDGPVLAVSVDDVTSSSSVSVDSKAGDGRFLRKKKGESTFFIGDNCVITIAWDVTLAKYSSGCPEPVSNFYVELAADSERILLLGDRLTLGDSGGWPVAELIGRKERFRGQRASYSTRAQFHAGCADHDVTIKCEEEDSGEKGPEQVLTVCVDGRNAASVGRLKWNFRGNHTIFIDGSPVDMMWDVHDWFFFGGGDKGGYAVFLFQARNCALDDGQLHSGHVGGGEEKPGLSLLIQAGRGPCSTDVNGDPAMI